MNKHFDEYDAQEERIQFFKEKDQLELYHLSLLEFLRTAQWDLIDYQNKEQNYDISRGNRFQKQYQEALVQVEATVTFANNYDYYVLAYPKRKMFFRIKRQVLILIDKIKKIVSYNILSNK